MIRAAASFGGLEYFSFNDWRCDMLRNTVMIGSLGAGLLVSMVASAEPQYPGADLMKSGTHVLGAPYYGPMDEVMATGKVGGGGAAVEATASASADPSPDKNGDGFVTADEAAPGSRWGKRLQTRDKNGDGKLSRDEYWFK